MRTNRKAAIISAAIVAGLCSPSLHAQTWNQTAAPTAPAVDYEWIDDLNWTGGTHPDAAGATANLTNDIAANQVIRLPAAGITLGTLNIGDSGAAPDMKFTVGNGATFNAPITFDNGVNNAVLNSNKDITAALNQWDQVWSNIKLNSDLEINATAPIAGATIRLNSAISDGANGPKGLIIKGPAWVELGQNGLGNSYTGLTKLEGGRLRLMSGGSYTLLPGDIEISGGATLQDGNANGNAIADDAVIRFVGPGFYNPGFDSTSDNERLGGFEGTGVDVQDVQLGGGAGTVRFGGDNEDHVFEGRIGSSTSWVKVGTGVQTFGGTLGSWQSSGTRTFGVLEGRVDLNKTAGVSSVAQTNVNIGDDTLSGVERPELRLLQSEQIQVNVFDGTPAETSVMTLSSGVFNLNGNSETLGTVTVSGNNPSTIALGNGGLLNVVAGGITVNAGSAVEVTSTSGQVAVKTNSLAADGKLDLTDNGLIVDYTGASEAANVRAKLVTGFAGGAWNGDGIMSSAAVGDKALGYGEASFIKGISDAQTASFGGQTVDATSVLVKFTYTGDTNLDGQVDIGDLGLLAGNWQQLAGQEWSGGDFTYDGAVDIGDLGLLAGNWQKGVGDPLGPTAGGVAAVPEPASFGVLSLAAVGLLRRNRRQPRH